MAKNSAFFGISVFSALLAFAPSASARRISDERGFEYEVRFTNPDCRAYRYAEEVRDAGGRRLTGPRPGAFCTRADYAKSIQRDASVFAKIAEWIEAPTTKSLFLSSLSFSESRVGELLCKAARRGVKVEFVLDSGTDAAQANKLKACSPRIQVHFRGNQGGLGFAHIKLLIVNPDDRETLRIAYGSANYSSGVSLHHENWSFVTVPAESHFAQAHLCAREGLVKHAASKASFAAHMRACRSDIDVAEEEDLKAYFAPAEGAAASKALIDSVARAREIRVAAHRFSYGKLLQSLRNRLLGGAQVKLVVDDDTYWAGMGVAAGDNSAAEDRAVKDLEKVGLDARFVQTNHFDGLLHHNKFAVMSDRSGSVVFTGAGNFTNAAFSDNFENFYLVNIPAVGEAYLKQHRHLSEALALPREGLPTKNVPVR